MKTTSTGLVVLGVCALVSACQEKVENESVSVANQKLLSILSPAESGIHFTNQITESESENYLLVGHIYQGAGVAIGDLNNDGLQDIFFCGNQVSDRIYLNQGNMQFKDITPTSGIVDDGSWSMGVTMADVNFDGLLDIYVSKHFKKDPLLRRNRLYINNGDLSFEEKALEYGIADEGYSVQSNFFDMDDDGDLDLFVANQPPAWVEDMTDQSNLNNPIFSCHIYKNDQGNFKRATIEAGVVTYHYALNVTTSDLDKDGDVDLYVPIDYSEADLLGDNNGKGKFANTVGDAMRHLSTFSMGSDAADINNDGYIDIYTADMVAEDNYRNKANMGGMNPQEFYNLAAKGEHYQYMFNCLQLNNGNGLFSEVAQLSGVGTTDWSWSPLFADLDNDGLKDLTVTNGILRDMRNKDYMHERDKRIEGFRKQQVTTRPEVLPLIELAPSVRIPNYAFRNLGGLNFEKVSGSWGFDFKGWTQGSAYGDLDNDGDIDLVVNNMNDVSHIYRNNGESSSNNNFMRVHLADGKNQTSMHSMVEIYYGNGEYQLNEKSPVRGYCSRSEDILHFGIGTETVVDSIIISWPNSTTTKLYDVESNQTITATIGDAKNSVRNQPTNSWFSLDTDPIIKYSHQENQFDDFKTEVLLPHKMSTLGPHLSVADINNDGKDDVFVGGSSGSAGRLFVSTSNGYSHKSGPWEKHNDQEELGSCFFDLDGDEDLDLYVTTGGNESPTGSDQYQDRLYVNNNGTFMEAALPIIKTSNGCVVAADIDSDGDEDLFVGGRQTPGKYPYGTSSYILRNNDGALEEVTMELAPELASARMVSDALWADLDNDGDQDLVIVGEWMPIMVFTNQKGKFSNSTAQFGLSNTSGWWNTIETADIDNDGDLDLIAGNLGYNIKYKATENEPFTVYSHDFDGNGTNDIVLSYYQKGKCYPVRGRECSSQQMPFIKTKYPTYNTFAKATVDQVYSESIEEALKLEVRNFSSLYLENRDGVFVSTELPVEAQISSVQSIVVHDLNDDGFKDLILAGNYYNREVETTRSDASIGYIMLGDGKGGFETIHPSKAGLKLYQDVRDIKLIKTAKGLKLIGAVNNDRMQSYSIKN